MPVFPVHQPVHSNSEEFCRPEDKGKVIVELVGNEY
jgi:hypothetical protein